MVFWTLPVPFLLHYLVRPLSFSARGLPNPQPASQGDYRRFLDGQPFVLLLFTAYEVCGVLSDILLYVFIISWRRLDLHVGARATARHGDPPINPQLDHPARW